MQVPARQDATLGCAAIAKAGHKPSSDKKRFGQSKGQRPSPGLFAAGCEASMGSGGPWTPNAYSASMPNFTRLDPNRPDVAMMIEAMIRASRLARP
jgi:hypothetical protein